MSMQLLGDKTKTVFLKGIESHKLHHEFQVAAGETIKVGQPVVLNSEGEVVPAAAAAKAGTVIGYSIHEGSAGEFVTVGMKAMAIVWASPGAALDAGPVKYAGLNTTDNTYNNFTAASADYSDLVGWALEDAEAADELIRVAII